LTTEPLRNAGTNEAPKQPAPPEIKMNPIVPSVPPPELPAETKNEATPPARQRSGLKSFDRIQPAPSKDTNILIPGPGPSTSTAPTSPTVSTTAMQPGDPSTALFQVQTAAVVVAKHGATVLPPETALPYEIVVRNLSQVPAQQVSVEDHLPPGSRVIFAEPMPNMQGDTAVWTIPVIAPHSQQTLRFTVQAGASRTGELMNQYGPSVRVCAGGPAPSTHSGPAPIPVDNGIARSVALRPRMPADALAIRLVAPNRLSVGKPAVFEIRVANQSAVPLNGMVLYGSLPEGLTTPNGQNIEGEVSGTLEPGETKTLNMPVSVVMAGRYAVKVKVTTKNGAEAATQTAIEIGSDELVVRQQLTGRLYVGRTGDYRIEITNPTGQTVRNVSVFNQLAEGLDFVSADARGLYQANSRKVYWLIDQLAPGQVQALTVRVYADKAGEYQNPVIVGADGRAEARFSGVIVAENASSLSLRVINKDGVLGVGKENVYEVHVKNGGQTPETNVRLQVEFPPGMTPRRAEGDTRHTVEKQRVVFEPIAVLGVGAQGEAIYRVSALAQSAGDQRVRFAVSSEQVTTPVTAISPTLVARD
jgi:uncharacterized repeat protein (TIGR01451 family)